MLDVKSINHTIVERIPYSKYAPDRHPIPTVGVKIAINDAAEVVPHCKPSAKVDAIKTLIKTPSLHIFLLSSTGKDE
jgi:hypothetical protein